jgi:hypothetical protein
MIREPLVHFCVIGIALFVVAEIHRRDADLHRIVVAPERTEQIANRYALQFGARPDAATLAMLVDRDAREEILFRQGLALHLDRDDEIVRRRVVEKMRFLLQDGQAPAEPSDAQLARYYETNATRYVTPVRVTFSHIYFAAGEGDEAARLRARQALAKLAHGGAGARDLGDSFPDLYDFAAYEPEQVFRLFGRTPFADAVLAVPIGEWSGPFKSSYGWHLIHVDARQPARYPALAEIRDQVRSDYLQQAQSESNAAAFAKLARDFTVVRSADASLR